MLKHLIPVALTALPFIANAAEHRHADAHVHGISQLTFAVAGNTVEIQLTAPGFDIVGFESISSEEHHDQLDAALEKLAGQPMWRFNNSAQCKITGSHTTDSFHAEGSDHKEHDHKRHDHHDHSEHDHGEHLDITATYTYSCKQPAKLASLSTDLFNQFPNAQTINVEGLLANKAVKGQLTRNASKMDF